MKNFFRLLIVAGLLTAGWLNRDVLRGLTGKGTTISDGEVQEPAAAGPAPAAAGRPTPHPATAAKAAATKAYPALGMADSAFNKRFRSFYEEAQFRNPALLSDPNWPLKLAERTAISLGGGAMPATPAPSSSSAKPGASGSKLQGSALDMRPGGTPAR